MPVLSKPAAKPSIEEAQTIITFIDELKTVLLANYGEEIQENHRANEVITDKGR
jgi:hypothetical protein